MKTSRPALALALAASLSWIGPLAARETAVPGNSPNLDMARQLNQAFIEVAEKVSPAVVVIQVAHKRSYSDPDDDNPLWEMLPPQFRRQFQDQLDRERGERGERGGRNRVPPQDDRPVFDAQGSGVVIREDGYILTNRHVVDGAAKIRVRFRSGKHYDAEIQGMDPQSDVAVIKIKAEGLTVAKLGDSAATRVGEFAIAIGAPFDLDYSVTYGHVSAKGRSQVIPAFDRATQSMDQDFIQTDASINPGNSGGPLINLNGEVIGINTLIRGIGTGIGFAIPINMAKEIAEKLISEGKFVRSWLGIQIKALSDLADNEVLASNLDNGVVVMGIQPDGPAAKSDLKASDIITAVDGHEVTTPQQLKNELRAKKIGENVVLDVVRRDKKMKVNVKPAAMRTDSGEPGSDRKTAGETSARRLGLTVQTLTAELAEEYGVDLTPGVVVRTVERGSIAEGKRIRPGDVITEVNRKAVTTAKQFEQAIKGADLKKGIIVNLITRGTGDEPGVSGFQILKDSGD